MSEPLEDPKGAKALSERKAFRGARRMTRGQKTADFLRENSWLWAAVFLCVSVFIFARHFRLQPPPPMPLGSPAPRDIRAPFDLQIQDEVATRQKRDEARARVTPLYDWDSAQGETLVRKISGAFAAARSVLGDYRQYVADPQRTAAEKRDAEEKALDALSDSMGGGLSRFALRQFQGEGFSPRAEQLVEALVAQVEARKIVADQQLLDKSPTIRIRDIRKAGAEWEQKNPVANEVISLATARRLPGVLMESAVGLPQGVRGAIEEYARSLIQPNLTFNSEETARRQDAAAAQVEPLVVFVKKGQTILKAGERVDDSAKQKIDAFQSASQAFVNMPLLMSLSLFVLLLTAFLFMYLKTYRKLHNPKLNLFVLVLQIMTIFLLVSQGLLIALRALAETARHPLLARPELLYFVIPVAAGAMLVTFLVDKHIAIVYSVVFSLLFGILLDFNYPMMLYSMLSCFTGVYAGYNLAQKAAQWRAGLLLGAVNAFLAAAVLSNDTVWDNPANLLLPAGLAFVSGIPLTTMLVSPLVPVFESGYGILTEVRLLELSNMNHPLLRRLALDAPGTYNHSVMMATLSEAAANAIGANGLFCRVACYYHDIGKILNPVYFVENQVPGQNPHDRLSPRISALIIAAHVKEGVAMARQYRLPQAVLDVIPQHHGTRKIAYFYDKALTLHDPEKGTIGESDYQYPGPKPQTREAAIIMLADGVEAGSRVLKDPSHQRLLGLIEEITSRVVREGQLEDCNLTFRDLAKVQDAFLQILVGVFSRRISYPGYRFDKEEEGAQSQAQK